MTNEEMQHVAASSGHESGFVFPALDNSQCDFEFRFWVPEHEMQTCGHATVGAIWMLEKLGRLPGNQLLIWTKSGTDKGVVVPLPNDNGIHEQLVSTLSIGIADLTEEYPIENSRTSRVKTTIPVKNVDILDDLKPQSRLVQGLCERIGSTGLYPYAAVIGERKHVFSARQFPKNSGYVEDAATGIAASALAFALLENGLVDVESEVTVKQGRAMGAPSTLAVRFRKGTMVDVGLVVRQFLK